MGMRVLLVDDSAEMRRMVRKLLERSGGYEIVGEAADGREGCDLALSIRPDLVIMDVSMPGMNGREALRCIAAQRPDLPVVMLSCHEEPAYVSDVKADGARGYVVKDHAVENLVNVLRAVASGEKFTSPGFEITSDPV